MFTPTPKKRRNTRTAEREALNAPRLILTILSERKSVEIVFTGGNFMLC
jgi:hypothetical protein